MKQLIIYCIYTAIASSALIAFAIGTGWWKREEITVTKEGE